MEVIGHHAPATLPTGKGS